MTPEAPGPKILQFGVFEVDLRSGELRKQGVRVKLQEQPFHVLTVLLQRPGEVVTREELRNQNWPTDTFVDFDNSLNTAINKLREALGDSADSPRFVETLPRRGYRFIAPVTGRDGIPRRTGAGVSSVTAPRSRKIVVAATVAVLAAGIAGGLLLRARQARRLTEKDTIVLGDFVNSTGDAVFDGTLREGLSVQLEQSPFLSLVSEEGIHQTLQMMGHPANSRLTPEVTREVCLRTNSTAALDGSIALLGTRYNLILRAINCANGDLLSSTEAQANDKSHVLDALTKAASDMRTKLGESLSTVQKYNTPIEEATTPSLEALQAYSLGFKAESAGDLSTAFAFYERATQIDANFAMAYLGMAGVSESVLAVENSRKAFALRDRVSALEKLIIEEEYAVYGSGDLPKGLQICELGERTYPRTSIFHEDRGQGLAYLGEYESGLKESFEALRLAPYRGVIYREIAHTYLYLNQPDKAEAAAKEARGKSLEGNLKDVLYGIAFYRQDAGEMARHAAGVNDVTPQQGLLMAIEADTAAYFGRVREGRELSRRAADSAEQAGEKEIATTYRAVSAFREALFGNAAIARQGISLRPPSSARDLDYAVALTFAYAGDVKRAQDLADTLSKVFSRGYDCAVQLLTYASWQTRASSCRPPRSASFSRSRRFLRTRYAVE
jgi:eukaryotic-like serine/threonine-protein kinase